MPAPSAVAAGPQAIAVPLRGTTAPGQPTPELSPLFRPGSTSMGRPGEAPAPESVIMVSGGRRLADQQQP